MRHLWEERQKEALQAREAAENRPAFEMAKHENRNVTFIAHDGCEVMVTPSGHLFYNTADWF